MPATALKGETNNNRAGTTFWQLRRAAWLVWRTLEFKDKLHSQELHPDTTRTGVFALLQLVRVTDHTQEFGSAIALPKCSTSREYQNLSATRYPHHQKSRRVKLAQYL